MRMQNPKLTAGNPDFVDPKVAFTTPHMIAGFWEHTTD
jgi:hypothetical protein